MDFIFYYKNLDASRLLNRYLGLGVDQRFCLPVSYPIPALAGRCGLLCEELLIREFSFHKLNANLVCPGTFSFSEWLVQQSSWVEGRCTIELGSSLLTKQFSLSEPSKHFLLAAKCAWCRDTENESQDLVLSDKSGLPYFSQIAVDFVCLVPDLKHHEKPSIQAGRTFLKRKIGLDGV